MKTVSKTKSKDTGTLKKSPIYHKNIMKTEIKAKSKQTGSLKKTESVLSKALGADRHALKHEIIRVRKSGKKSASSSENMEKKLFHLEKQKQASIRRKMKRKENLSALINKIDDYGANLLSPPKKMRLLMLF